MIDDADYDELNRYNWRVHKSSAARTKKGYHDRYVVERYKGAAHIRVQLSRQLMNVVGQPDLLVSYRDGDTLNLQRANLVIARKQEVGSMRRKQKNKASSQYKGVCWHKQAKRWAARIVHDGQSYHLGYFIDEEKAAKAYNEAALRYFGAEFSRLNAT
jgi:hypothetical protein